MNEYEWEERLKESDRLTDAYQEVLEKYMEDPDSERKEAFVMGWDGLLGSMADREEDEDYDDFFDDDEDDDDSGSEWMSADDDDDEEEETLIRGTTAIATRFRPAPKKSPCVRSPSWVGTELMTAPRKS